MFFFLERIHQKSLLKKQHGRVTKPRRREWIFRQRQERTQCEYEQAGGGRRRRERSHLFQMCVQLCADVMRCDAMWCSHSRAGHVQRLHNPGFSWQTAPPAHHRSISLSLSVPMLSTAECSRHRWSALAPHMDLIAAPGGAGRVSKGKSDRGSGNMTLRMDKLR